MPRQRQTLFLIDGSHYDRLKSVFEAPLDLRKLAQIASNGASIDRAFYYRDIRDEKEEERQRPLFNWLGHHGFAVKGRAHGPDEARERYGTNLVEIAVVSGAANYAPRIDDRLRIADVCLPLDLIMSD
ncbi:hypothetical protein SJ05684_c20850 [Sinorhizobium sojae CCBAU 05684]|uniref:NYN domain-containing protein n=1 Tax=Sinorhizobium sojae CCBAU 05684 TaxID=716928 RepID=A0A249PCH3_9HYPH|nr:hypothetical protein [Sinorhizobium sojae]ASY63526.1 hypothetical protein SJ05684_c20850 [Sinorhizobium sojae CCBAU 05684]